jgi:hypothetical protein
VPLAQQVERGGISDARQIKQPGVVDILSGWHLLCHYCSRPRACHQARKMNHRRCEAIMWRICRHCTQLAERIDEDALGETGDIR